MVIKLENYLVCYICLSLRKVSSPVNLGNWIHCLHIVTYGIKYLISLPFLTLKRKLAKPEQWHHKQGTCQEVCILYSGTTMAALSVCFLYRNLGIE